MALFLAIEGVIDNVNTEAMKNVYHQLDDYIRVIAPLLWLIIVNKFLLLFEAKGVKALAYENNLVFGRLLDVISEVLGPGCASFIKGTQDVA